VPFGDTGALAGALADPDVVAFLLEPIQGEAGVIIPPPGYLRAVRDLCTKHRVIMIADEIQSGLGRTGRTFACEHEAVQPDVFLVGKALGGGIIPVSAVVGTSEVLGVLRPGEHGSTFGGNPMACAIGIEVIRLLNTGTYQERATRLGAHMVERLRSEAPARVREIRGRGLWVGIDLDPDGPPARDVSEQLIGMGVLVKDTHRHTLRVAPPLVISQDDLESATDTILEALAGHA
jgi:ornithine--oxo-acid transaminase